MDLLKAKGAFLVSVACHQDCKLAKMCDMSVHLPLRRELCPFDLAPVTSTALQMIFGDTVAIALMQASHFAPRCRTTGWLATLAGALRDRIKHIVNDYSVFQSCLIYRV